MKISLNGVTHETNAKNLHEFLQEIELADAVVATAINGEFIAQNMRAQTIIQAGDQIEILAPMQGG